MKQKLLYLCPHLSTGGLPQYTFYCIQQRMAAYDIYVIEYDCIASLYTVQRDKIKTLLPDGHLITLPKALVTGTCSSSEKYPALIEAVEKIKPDVIHIQEFPEIFMEWCAAQWLYRGNRSYKIIETTHTVDFDPKNKKFYPDKFSFVSSYFIERYKHLKIPSEVDEYTLEKKSRPDRTKALKELGLEPDCLHILNVGLFTPNKNQKEIIKIARILQHYPIKFHFIGNTAENFADYWKPLIIGGLPSNCVVWGEQRDVDKFYSAMDLFLFTSKKETNPLVVKEAIAWDMPCFIYNLEPYGEVYDNESLIQYLTGNIIKDCSAIISKLKEKSPMEINQFLQHKDIHYHYVIKPRITFKAIGKDDYTAQFINNDTGAILYEYIHHVNSDEWQEYYSEVSYQYFINWKLVLKRNDKIIFSDVMNLKRRRVFIQIASNALGDTIAWIPYVEEFREKHKCEVLVGCSYKELFEKKYKNIQFLSPGEAYQNVTAGYFVGACDDYYYKIKNNWRDSNLQKISADVLGLEFREIKPKINVNKKVKYKKPYICISEFGSLMAKNWNYPGGWQIVSDYIISKGYDVRSISFEKSNLNNVKKHNGRSIEDTVATLAGANGFIGVGSGLSWLAWGLNIPVIMISGFSKPIAEFTTGIIRLHDETVCNGCFNDSSIPFIRNNNMWCPRGKDFECSKAIKPEQVIESINTIIGS
jgi:autotransporter strand-loop-strand O-heptosyltransferase